MAKLPPAEGQIAISIPDEIKRHIFPNYPDEAQIAKFFDVLGRAVALWQLVESGLYEVYERAVLPRCPGAAAAAFHAIQTFKMKLLATDAAVRFACLEQPELVQEWAKLRKDADAKYERRNQFVHLSAYILFDAKHPNDRIRLEPQLFDTRHLTKPHPPPKLRMTEIAEISKRFEPLARTLMGFAKRLPDPERPNQNGST